MKSERWKEVERLYYLAITHPPSERAAVLEHACPLDADLRRDVESLLEAREDAGSFLSSDGLEPHLAELGSGRTSPAAGFTIGPYRILSGLGAGGMGEVYRARDTRLEREVALKILPSYFAHDAARLSRFRREAQAASGLNHPNIVTIYEIGQAEETWFIAAELIEGITLRERLTQGKLPWDEAIGIAIQCAEALGAAHRAAVIHRDIKPENLMVRPDGVVKVIDFGIARGLAAGEGQAIDLTQTVGVMGTPRYMSPEQARGEKLDPRTDIFSLGAVLYEMICGRQAFPGSTTAEVFAGLLEKEPPPSGYGLDAILARALQKDRAKRYQTMEEFTNELRRADLRQTPGRASGVRTARPLKARIAMAASLAGLLVAIGFASRAWTGGSARDATIDLVPLTAFSGSKDYAAFSPDSQRIAFSWNGGREGVAERHIYIKPVATGDPLQLTFGAEDDTLPAWSPDGQNIAFVRRMPGPEFVVYIVSATGAGAHRISSGGKGVSWSPDGKWLALAAPPVPQGSNSIFLLSLKTGERRQLTASPRNGRDEFPAWSPDGRWIAFMRHAPEPEAFIVPATGGPVRQLTFDSRLKLGVITWTANSRELLYSTEREYGGEGLWRVAIDGGKARRISGALQFAGNPNVSRTGDRVAYTESWIDTNIYLSTAARPSVPGVPGSFGPAVKIIASSREDHSPSFSPDGEKIVFVSNRTGHSEIWTSRRDGSEAAQLTYLESFAGSPRWSPDAKFIAFDLIKNGSDIWVVPAAGGQARQLTNDPAQDTKPAWSPDGAWIYFNSGRGGSDEIWKIRPDGSGPMQLTQRGGREPFPSTDGSMVFYTKSKTAQGASIWSVPSGGGPEKPVSGMEEYNRIGRAWGLLEKGIYFISGEPGAAREPIRFFQLSGRRVVSLAAWVDSSEWMSPNVSISADGRYLLTVREDQQANDLMMIQNFR